MHGCYEALLYTTNSSPHRHVDTFSLLHHDSDARYAQSHRCCSVSPPPHLQGGKSTDMRPIDTSGPEHDKWEEGQTENNKRCCQTMQQRKCSNLEDSTKPVI